MNDTVNPSTTVDRIRSWARSRARAAGHNPFATENQGPSVPLREIRVLQGDAARSSLGAESRPKVSSVQPSRSNIKKNADNHQGPPSAPVPEGEAAAIEEDGDIESKNWMYRAYLVTKMIIFSSWMNILLVFVPVGIALHFAHVKPTAVFVVNAIAIVPLAGLLGYATESVARKMGDTIGALMNVTFGNAVELIIL